MFLKAFHAAKFQHENQASVCILSEFTDALHHSRAAQDIHQKKIDTGEIASHKNAFYMCKISEQKPAVNVHGNLYVAGQAWNFFIEHVKRKGTDA